MKDFETIVVDDGSTDETAEIVKRCYPEVAYHYQVNQGQAAARNKGVSLARGEYVAFCDHDDVWNERHLEKLSGCIESHPNTGMVFDNAEYFGDGVGQQFAVGGQLLLSPEGPGAAPIGPVVHFRRSRRGHGFPSLRTVSPVGAGPWPRRGAAFTGRGRPGEGHFVRPGLPVRSTGASAT